MSVPGFCAAMFEKVLVANRGEIAVRILRTLKEMGIESVAVYSEADVEALPARLADEAVLIGPPAPAQSYLNVESVLAAAGQTGASAIHPGYGFLSENARFAEACATAGLTFIGPSPESLRLAGNKLQARRSVESAGVPVIPGSNQPLRELSVARRLAASIGYPAMLKAAAGGGGKGIRPIADEDALVEAFPLAQAEARASFGDPTLYLERRIEGARHIEVQVLRDSKGKAVHLGETQLLSPAPSPEAARGSAVARASARGRAPASRSGLDHRGGDALPERGDGRVPGRRGQSILFPGGERSHSGGTSGHRSHHRRRPSAGAGRGSGNRRAVIKPERHRVSRSCHRVPYQRGRSGRRFPPPTGNDRDVQISRGSIGAIRHACVRRLRGAVLL